LFFSDIKSFLFDTNIDSETINKINDIAIKLHKISEAITRTNHHKASFRKCVSLLKEKHDLENELLRILEENNCDSFDISAFASLTLYGGGTIIEGANGNDKVYKQSLKQYKIDVIEYEKFIENEKEKERIDKEQKRLAEEDKKKNAEKKLLSELLEKYNKEALEECSDNAPILDPQRKYI
jgi:hypothetical protein